MLRKLVFSSMALSASLLNAQSAQNWQDPTPTPQWTDDGKVMMSHAASGRSVEREPLSFAFNSLEFPGANFTLTFGINNQEQVVGSYFLPPGRQHALLIDQGEFKPLAPSSVLGNHLSQAFDINERGDVVGAYVDDLGVRHGFLLSNDVASNIDFPGATRSDAFGINNSGVIVGDFFDAAGTVHGFVLQDGTLRELDFPGAVDTQALSINNAGDIVGAWDTDPDTRGHGFLLTGEGRFISIDDPDAAPQSTSAIGINDRGQIVGSYEDGFGVTHGFVLAGGSFTSVNFPGADLTSCRAINNQGEIVGNYFIGDIVAAGFLAKPAQH